MSVEQIARITREYLGLELDKSDKSWIINFVPLGGLKDAESYFPRIKLIHRNSDGLISAILDIKKVNGSYQLESVCTPDYSRLNPQTTLSNGLDEIHLIQEDLFLISGLESLACQSEYIAHIVSVQIALSTALERGEDPSRYKIN